jgi:hypothetical protein
MTDPDPGSDTDETWPVPADRVHRGATRSNLRHPGAPQDDVQHGHRPGSRVCLAIESDRAGRLLLLDEDLSGNVYCLCPSLSSPRGRAWLPASPTSHSRARATTPSWFPVSPAACSDRPTSLRGWPGCVTWGRQVDGPVDVLRRGRRVSRTWGRGLEDESPRNHQADRSRWMA